MRLDHNMENGNGNTNGHKDPEVAMATDNSDEEDEEDPVVHEIPVFLAKSLADNLYLFQYPVRPAHMSYDASTVLSSRVRPRNHEVELTLGLDTASSNYDASKGEQIALNVDGSDPKADHDNKVYPSGIMDKQTLTSTVAAKDPSRYAVGILGSNELHITPIQSVLQLRPHLGYLDKSDKTAKAEGRPVLGENPDDPDDPGAEEDVKQVTVRFAKSDSEAAKRNREKSYEFQVAKREEEAWISTRHHHMKTDWWEVESQKLFCKKMDDEIVPPHGEPTDPGNYLENLIKVDESELTLPGANAALAADAPATTSGVKIKKEK